MMNEFTIDIEKKLSRLGRDIQEFVEKIVPVHDMEGDFLPDSDIVESENEFRIEIDLPGMNKNQIRIALKDNVLRVSGERELQLQEGENLKRKERKAGVFSRSFALPEYISASDTSASFKNGVLSVSLPKKGEDKEGESIPIQ